MNEETKKEDILQSLKYIKKAVEEGNLKLARAYTSCLHDTLREAAPYKHEIERQFDAP